MRLRYKFLSAILACLMMVGIIQPAMAADSAGFTDVDPDAWYAQAVAWCRENEIMSGTSETEFSPDTPMSRAMLATVLWRIEDRPVVNYYMVFSDVEEGGWYTEAVRCAASERIVDGCGGGVFGTDDQVTREQLATILWRYAGRPSSEPGDAFADGSDISSFAAAAVRWTKANNIVGGVGGNRFDPKSGAKLARQSERDRPRVAGWAWA